MTAAQLEGSQAEAWIGVRVGAATRRVEGSSVPGTQFKYAGFGFEGNDRAHRSSLLGE